jgi:hypothetical protein
MLSPFPLTSPPQPTQELDLEGANEETGRQLCALMTTMADMHWAHIDSVAKQHQILKYVSVTLGVRRVQ